MKFVTAITLIIFCVLLNACGPMAYQSAIAWDKDIRNGFLDKEIKPGIYIIEVREIGGEQQIEDYEGTIKLYIGYWHRRANELCPNGYTGKPEIIFPSQAKIDGFRCDKPLCQNYKMVSGIADCY